MRLGRLLALTATLALADAGAMATTRPADAAEPIDAFKARMVQNIGVATKAASALSSIGKRKAPKGIKGEQRRAYDEQSRWLVEASARFAAMKARMETALAKARPSPAEIAQLNLEFVTVRDAAQAESSRFDGSSSACHARHVSALAALRAD
jgi:hypothetical protein